MDVLVVMGLQNDFNENGKVPVKDVGKVISVVNRLMRKFELVVCTRDWHLLNHMSFVENQPGKGVGEVIEINGEKQTLWPLHCVQNTPGADFIENFDTSKVKKVFSKGTNPRLSSYNGMTARDRSSTCLDMYLKQKNVDKVFFAGLTLEYCIRVSALSAIGMGFDTYVVLDACRGVELNKRDIEKAITEMITGGVKIITSDTIMI